MVGKMEDDFRLQDSKIAIIGLGLMGGSLALALKGKCAALYGIDSHLATLEFALDRKLVDDAETSPAKLLRQADLVILATPVPVIVSLLQQLPSLTTHRCIVLDLGSTKSKIISAMDHLPPHFEVIGGHPICGKEKLGVENADAVLYENAPFVITPLERTTFRARTAIKNMISVIGARLIEMDAEDHDRALAFTSHLPFLVSSALALTVPQENARLIGSGFRSTARLAGTPSSMMLGVIQSNRENILHALHYYQHELAILEAILMSNDEAVLQSRFSSAQSRYQAMIE
jgi:prephenate dehydrogenase